MSSKRRRILELLEPKSALKKRNQRLTVCGEFQLENTVLRHTCNQTGTLVVTDAAQTLHFFNLNSSPTARLAKCAIDWSGTGKNGLTSRKCAGRISIGEDCVEGH